MKNKKTKTPNVILKGLIFITSFVFYSYCLLNGQTVASQVFFAICLSMYLIQLEGGQCNG